MDENYAVAFQLIMNAGNSKSLSMMAMESAREFNFEEAEKYLKEAELEMRSAHQSQIDLIQQEAQGNPVDVNIILVHAQDHLTMAMMAKDQAAEILNLYRMIKDLKDAIVK
ncbi:PTS lactose/cellobiose transporter subunit IIA [Lacrimispora sphenoides]|uniref:PTS system, cellobiose-specific IIA component n=1 Tax=Lacrimispora sphenoides JCM 1415 TaxID=1297793 RepID=A0ABY1CJ05_9FIRM|nr:PTS lactose/cellobiose transporter subunit IIA [Lacrimispora sphenoides]SEU06311.1 PTS system, cellobiose-specific IIA component [[Clostridium] sphenoides JCM 1415]SUY49108.1 PTS system lactose/cellobiose-specific transporter subunit IIA [Lacrimispora sphenoides]